MQCDSVAIDPQFRIEASQFLAGKRAVHLFQMPSDEFFRDYDLRRFLPNGVDLAFLDGMHRYEFLLSDFINTERCCRRNSIILMHDCLPRDTVMTSRIPVHGEWTGDVWKILPALQKYRPDLKVHALNCPPTGLVAITNLDPDARPLSDHYFKVVDEFVDLNDPSSFYKSVSLVDSQPLVEHEKMTKLFWL